LLDHCVPKPFARELPAHEVRTAAQMGWSGLQNGKLLAEAAGAAFDAFLTVDKNIRHQQNLTTLPLAVIVLDTPMNTPVARLPFAPFVEVALLRMNVGQMVSIDVSGRVTEVAPGRSSP
jgi:hypothetical protein